MRREEEKNHLYFMSDSCIHFRVEKKTEPNSMALRIDAAYLQESHKLSTRQRRTAFDNA